MSRSRKLPILKDRPRNCKKSSIYWRTVRRVINEKVKLYKDIPSDDVNLPEPKEIVNDYDYSDWKRDYRDPDWLNIKDSKIKEHIQKQKRK